MEQAGSPARGKPSSRWRQEKASISQLLDAWKTGDAPAVRAESSSRIRKGDPVTLPAAARRERNRNWLPKIDELFALRGAARWSSSAPRTWSAPDGALAMLKAKGLHDRTAVDGDMSGDSGFGIRDLTDDRRRSVSISR